MGFCDDALEAVWGRRDVGYSSQLTLFVVLILGMNHVDWQILHFLHSQFVLIFQLQDIPLDWW